MTIYYGTVQLAQNVKVPGNKNLFVALAGDSP